MLLYYVYMGAAPHVPPPPFNWKSVMARFSVVSNVANVFAMLVLKDGQVWNFTTNTAEGLPANNTPTAAHLLPVQPFKPSGPLATYKQVHVPLATELLVGSDLVILSGDANGANLSVLDSWPYQFVESPWIGRGGWSK